MDSKLFKALNGSAIEFYNQTGTNLTERCKPLDDFAKIRTEFEINPYSNCVMHSPIAPYVQASVGGGPVKTYLNFSSQDYMGLTQNELVKKAAHDVIDELGIHTASSPAFTGKNQKVVDLEEKLAGVLGMDQAILFTAGWMACFGAIVSLVSPKDVILLDGYSHNSLQTAAKNATEKIYKFHHNDVVHLEKMLKTQRTLHPRVGIFVVIESLYSMHSDVINLKSMLEVINKYNAILILDIAHDFGVLGENGLGVLEGFSKEEKENIVIIGAFTKAFGTNGGFVAGKNIIRPQTMLFSPSYTFSNSISPIQTAIALKSAEILFSDEGKKIRQDFYSNIIYAREKFNENGFLTNGGPSPIVPVIIGEDVLARLMYKENTKLEMLANLAEFPAVPKNQSLFRFQLMATHTKEQISLAVEKLKISQQNAKNALSSML